MKIIEPAAALGVAIEGALRALARKPPDDASAHAVRKHLKHACAALRLLRESVGDTAYRRENRRLRDAARPLSRMRDARIAEQTLATLRSRTPAERTVLQQLSTRPANEQQSAQRELASDRLDGVSRSLRMAQHTAQQWQKQPAARAAVRSDLKRAYRKARKAAAASREKREDVRLHEARKQAKYLGNMLKILRPRLAGGGKARRRAFSLGEILGDDHDLAVLQEQLRSSPDAAQDSSRLLTQIKKRRRRLQDKAMEKAKRLYKRRPGRFVRKLALT